MWHDNMLGQFSSSFDIHYIITMRIIFVKYSRAFLVLLRTAPNPLILKPFSLEACMLPFALMTFCFSVVNCLNSTRSLFVNGFAGDSHSYSISFSLAPLTPLSFSRFYIHLCIDFCFIISYNQQEIDKEVDCKDQDRCSYLRERCLGLI